MTYHARKYLFAGLFALVCCVGAFAQTDLPVSDHPSARAVLDQHFILVTLPGSVDIPFYVATFVFQQDDILMQVQDEYARLLPEGEQPEFTVEQETPTRWSYVNRKDQQSVIEELYRDLTPGQAEFVYHTTGRRFFGEFEALTHVRLRPDDGQSTTYEVMVYAYPQVAVARFFARHLKLVERYFVDKTDELTALTVSICRGLMEQQAQRLDDGVSEW